MDRKRISQVVRVRRLGGAIRQKRDDGGMKKTQQFSPVGFQENFGVRRRFQPFLAANTGYLYSAEIVSWLLLAVEKGFT